MTTLLPVDALIARADRVEEIVAPQYDSFGRGGRYQYAAGHPDCFLNVVLSREDVPESDIEEPDIAVRAKQHFSGMLKRGLFPAYGKRAFFLYELSSDTHRQVGLVAGVPTGAITDGQVRGHEGTIHDRAADLADFYRTARLTSSPVAMAFNATDEQRALLDRLETDAPIRDFTGWDGVRQRLWAIDEATDIEAVQKAMEGVDSYYITDGHHRVAAAQMEETLPGWFLGVLFPADQVHVLEYNRCVALAVAPSIDTIKLAVGADWEVEAIGEVGVVDPRPTTVGEISMLVEGIWYRLRFVADRPGNPVGGLDVCLLHDRVLAPAFGISDDHDDRLSFVVGEDAGTRLEEVVRSEPNTVAFALFPTSVDELFAVADAELTMPAKSTWFTPKPRSGLIVVRW